MTLDYLTAVTCAFLISLGVPIVLSPLLARAGIVSIPNARSSHTTTTLRGGGLAQVLGMTVGLAVAIFAADDPDRRFLWVVLGVALAAALLGWIEDFRGVAIATRAGIQFVIGLFAMSIAAIQAEEPLWWATLGAIALLGLTNVVNFMDGVNAISSFHGIIVGLSFVIIGQMNQANWLSVSGAVLAAAFAAFLPWNINGRIFLGDVGSYLLGGTTAILITIGWMDGLPIIALAAPMAIYVADTGVTLVSRIRAGASWHEAHRDHTYQRFNRSGLSHLRVAAVVAISSLACSFLGIGASESSGVLRIGLLGVIALVVVAYTAARFVVKPSELTVALEKEQG